MTPGAERAHLGISQPGKPVFFPDLKAAGFVRELSNPHETSASYPRSSPQESLLSREGASPLLDLRVFSAKLDERD